MYSREEVTQLWAEIRTDNAFPVQQKVIRSLYGNVLTASPSDIEARLADVSLLPEELVPEVVKHYRSVHRTFHSEEAQQHKDQMEKMLQGISGMSFCVDLEHTVVGQDTNGMGSDCCPLLKGLRYPFTAPSNLLEILQRTNRVIFYTSAPEEKVEKQIMPALPVSLKDIPILSATTVKKLFEVYQNGFLTREDATKSFARAQVIFPGLLQEDWENSCAAFTALKLYDEKDLAELCHDNKFPSLVSSSAFVIDDYAPAYRLVGWPYAQSNFLDIYSEGERYTNVLDPISPANVLKIANRIKEFHDN